MNKNSRIFIAGHNGLVGSALVKKLSLKGYSNLILRNSSELDLTVQSEVMFFFELEKPEYVFMAAAKVGGIKANNNYKATFIYDNLIMQANVIHAAYLSKVKKLLFLGSSCVYPKFASQPLKEEYLLSGSLEPTNEPYAIAKIAGIKMCEAYNFQYGCDFLSVMPTNLYGPNDNYDLENSHVLPALIRKFHEAKMSDSETVTIWGSGSPMREFMYSEDMAEACILIMEQESHERIINIGSGKEVSIKDLALIIKEIVGFKGEIEFDITKPDGSPRKLLDISILKARGFKGSVSLEEGILLAYEHYLKSLN